MKYKRKKKPLHEYFSINDIEYLVMESLENKGVNLYIHTDSLLHIVV